jgi:transcriptional regulator with XRE-family HTH domain
LPKLANSFRPTIEQVNAFSKLFLDARKLRGKTQQEVADESGVSQTMISTLEHGPYAGMNFVDVVKLASYYGIAPNTLAASIGLFEVESDNDFTSFTSQLQWAYYRLVPEKQQTALRLIQAAVQILLDEQAVWKSKLSTFE